LTAGLVNYLAISNTADVIGGKPIAVWSQSTSGVSAVNPLAAYYDIHGGTFYPFYSSILFCPGHHTRHKFLKLLLWAR
jgi:hypothetical protein